MTKITFVQPDGSRTNADAPIGHTLLQVAVDNDVAGILGECGGACQCATCHVYVDASWIEKLPAASDMEDSMLDGTAAERRANSRLGCEITIGADLDGLVVMIPGRQV